MKRVSGPRKPGGRAKRACVRNSKVPQWARALEIGSESESELLEAPASSPELYCVCRTPYNEAQRYISCDSCHGWSNFDCVAATSRDAFREKYFCPACANHANALSAIGIGLTDAHDTACTTSFQHDKHSELQYQSKSDFSGPLRVPAVHARTYARSHTCTHACMCV